MNGVGPENGNGAPRVDAVADELLDDVVEGEVVDDEGDAPVIDADVVGGAPPGGGLGDDTLVEEGSIDSIAVDIAALTNERDEYLGALQRLQADFENYRKRVARQQEEQSARAAFDLVGRILPVLDVLDLAHAHLTTPAGDQPAPPSGAAGANGDGGQGSDGGEDGEGRALRQARSMLLDTLRKEGLDRVDQHGVAFDPSVHDAVAHAEDDNGNGDVTVDEVLRAGYLWRGQVLRPAMVRVRG